MSINTTISLPNIFLWCGFTFSASILTLQVMGDFLCHEYIIYNGSSWYEVWLFNRYKTFDKILYTTLHKEIGWRFFIFLGWSHLRIRTGNPRILWWFEGTFTDVYEWLYFFLKLIIEKKMFLASFNFSI
jgi:hypothetical protein